MERAIQSEADRKIGGKMQLRHRDQQEAEAGKQQEMLRVAKAIQGIRPQIRILPLRISHHSRQSPIRLNQGYLNVAGLLCSKKKCPTQANA